ncbi:MAG: MBL fold metallo-hydrolase [Patescibacteria group bacterium]
MKGIATITFSGGAGSVTGSNFLFEADGKKILVDCGLLQGVKLADDINWEPFPYEPKEVDILFVTHAHVDHLGRIPKLLAEGFRGKILSTPPTRALAGPMLDDAAGILRGNPHFALEKIYTEERLRETLSLWQSVDYHAPIKITENLSATLLNSGHILGSAMVEFIFHGKKILFTSDLGNSPSLLLPDNERVTDADYLVIESVYGDRNHESHAERRAALERIIQENYTRKGTLLIPVFSLERSQELLFELNNLVEEKRIPIMPIFFDSPLAIRLTEIFKRYKDYFNDRAQAAMVHDKYLFDFPGLHSTLKSSESKMIDEVPNPKIIIAGSGMSSGGRIIFHERRFLPDPNNTILLAGYQSAGTPGRLIQEGVRTVRIGGEFTVVRARVVTISGYSGHKDSDGLLEFVAGMEKRVKKVFVVMGEQKSAMYLTQKIRDNSNIDAYAPERGDKVTLEC